MRSQNQNCRGFGSQFFAWIIEKYLYSLLQVLSTACRETQILLTSVHSGIYSHLWQDEWSFKTWKLYPNIFFRRKKRDANMENDKKRSRRKESCEREMDSSKRGNFCCSYRQSCFFSRPGNPQKNILDITCIPLKRGRARSPSQGGVKIKRWSSWWFFTTKWKCQFLRVKEVEHIFCENYRGAMPQRKYRDRLKSMHQVAWMLQASWGGGDKQQQW